MIDKNFFILVLLCNGCCVFVFQLLNVQLGCFVASKINFFEIFCFCLFSKPFRSWFAKQLCVAPLLGNGFVCASFAGCSSSFPYCRVGFEVAQCSFGTAVQLVVVAVDRTAVGTFPNGIGSSLKVFPSTEREFGGF